MVNNFSRSQRTKISKIIRFPFPPRPYPREFLKLFDFHFPPGHILHSVLNRSTIKVSYRCLPNMGAQVARHNSKVLRNSKEVMTRPPPSCNCQKSKVENCPLPGACNQDGVVYQSTITSRSQESYIGLAKNFKKRFRKHRDTMKEKKTEGNTTLSNHYWKEVEAGGDPKVTWKVLESNIPTYNPVTKICKLCIRQYCT